MEVKEVSSFQRLGDYIVKRLIEVSHPIYRTIEGDWATYTVAPFYWTDKDLFSARKALWDVHPVKVGITFFNRESAEYRIERLKAFIPSCLRGLDLNIIDVDSIPSFDPVLAEAFISPERAEMIAKDEADRAAFGGDVDRYKIQLGREQLRKLGTTLHPGCVVDVEGEKFTLIQWNYRYGYTSISEVVSFKAVSETGSHTIIPINAIADQQPGESRELLYRLSEFTTLEKVCPTLEGHRHSGYSGYGTATRW